MIKEEYKTACRLKEQTKYNIDYDSCQILNLTCANYIYDLIQQSTKYEVSLESIKKMLAMIYELLGHEIKYTIPQYIGDKKKCYYGVVANDFVIDSEDIKQLSSVFQSSNNFTNVFSTSYQKILYAHPSEFGDISSIKDQNQFEIRESFEKKTVIIDNVQYNVYIIKDASSVDNYKIYFV